MTIHPDLDLTQKRLVDLERAVRRLEVCFGPHVDVQRLTDDVARFSADLARLRQHAPKASSAVAHRDMIVISDEPYDPNLWADGDVDAEGLGVPGRRAP